MNTLRLPGPFPKAGRSVRLWTIAALILFSVGTASAWQDGSTPAVPNQKASPYTLLSPDVIELRLRAAPRNNDDREAALDSMFVQAGCRGADLSEEPVKHEKYPNLICRMPGSLDSTIIVGAHFDKVARGGGVVDNWSGAALLPSLFQTLDGLPRKHTFLFIGFTHEERRQMAVRCLVGSRYYVSHMTPEDLARTRAMVNIDTLALGPTKIWLTHSDPKLASGFYGVAQSMKLPVGVVNADDVAHDDSESFMRRKIPTLMIHSITNQTLHILHSPDDNLGAVKLGDYYDSYRLIAAYLAWIDEQLD